MKSTEPEEKVDASLKSKIKNSSQRPSLKAPATPPRKIVKPKENETSSVVASLFTPGALKRAKSQANAEKTISNKGNTIDDGSSTLNSLSSNLFQKEDEEPIVNNQEYNSDEADVIELFDGEPEERVDEQQPVMSVITPPPRRKPNKTKGNDVKGRQPIEKQQPVKKTTSKPNQVNTEGAVNNTEEAVINTEPLSTQQVQQSQQEEEGVPTITSPLYKYQPGGDRTVPRSYTLSNGLNVFIISDDDRLSQHASAFGVIEYNGHDAFEYGAVGQVTAKLDARPPPPGSPPGAAHDLEALFTFLQEEQ